MDDLQNTIETRLIADENTVFETYKSNTFYDKLVFVLSGHQTRLEILSQLFGNIGCRATKYDNPLLTDFILLNDVFINSTPNIIKYGGIDEIVNTYDIIKSKRVIKFISEARFLQYISFRSQSIKDMSH
jgi:hypothetical protein